MRRLLLMAVLAGYGCSHHPADDPEALCARVDSEIEAGELIRAAAGAQTGRAQAVARRDTFFEWRFRLAQAEILLFSRRAEPALTALEGDLPGSPRFLALAARRFLLQARAVSMLHRADESETLLQKAWEAAEAANASETLADIAAVRSIHLESQQKFEESDALLRKALDLTRSIGSRYREAGILVNMGFNRLRRTRFDDAAGYFEQASKVAGPEHATLYTVAQQNLAICYTSLGDPDRAIAIQQEAAARHERSGAKAFLATALGELGRTYLTKNDFRQAATYMDRALTISLETNATRDAAVWASNLSNVYLELGDLANAESLNQESIRLRTADHDARLYYNELNAARIAGARGDRTEAARRYSIALKDGISDPSVTWEAEEGLGQLSVAAGNPAEAVPHFERALDIVEQTRAGLERTEFKLPFLTRLIRLYGVYVETLLSLGQTERALAVADSSRAQVLAERSGAPRVRRLPPAAYRDLARSTGKILLSYWLGAQRSHAWVVTGEGVHHVELPGAHEIEVLVAAYQEAVERQLADPARTHLAAGERLFHTLIEPVRQWIPPGSQVVLAADGALHGLNLEALPVSGDTPRYWVEDVTVSIAPSLALLSPRKEGVGQSRLLIIGDPAGVDPSYPALAYAGTEMTGITQGFGAERTVVISRERATPDSWRQVGPGAFRAIHFTAHATANRESPLDSAVLLAGGKLYARDILSTQLVADLVTISACRGVGTRLYSGEGLVGFAWAFLHAGARNVIAGLWDVNDQSTSRLMQILYREIAAGQAPAAALHTAKLDLVRSNGNLRKPYYWAPFQLYTLSR